MVLICENCGKVLTQKDQNKCRDSFGTCNRCGCFLFKDVKKQFKEEQMWLPLIQMNIGSGVQKDM